jgi:hypothetical protein
MDNGGGNGSGNVVPSRGTGEAMQKRKGSDGWNEEGRKKVRKKERKTFICVLHSFVTIVPALALRWSVAGKKEGGEAGDRIF